MFLIALAVLLLSPGIAIITLEILIWQRKAGRRFEMSSWIDEVGITAPYGRLPDDREMAVFKGKSGLLVARLIGNAGTLCDMNEEGRPWSIGRPGEGMEDIADPLRLARRRADEIQRKLGVPVAGAVVVAHDTGFIAKPPFGVFRPEEINGILSGSSLFDEGEERGDRVEKAWKSLKLVKGNKILRLGEIYRIIMGLGLFLAGLTALFFASAGAA